MEQKSRVRCLGPLRTAHFADRVSSGSQRQRTQVEEHSSDRGRKGRVRVDGEEEGEEISETSEETVLGEEGAAAARKGSEMGVRRGRGRRREGHQQGRQEPGTGCKNEGGKVGTCAVLSGVGDDMTVGDEVAPLGRRERCQRTYTRS